MKTHRLMLGVLVAAGFSTTAHAADHLLSGTITSAAGEKLEGVTVSAKAEGSTITTSVYTDEQRQLLFPAAAGRQVQRLGAGAGLRADEGRGRSHGREARGPHAQADDGPRAADAPAAGRDADGGAAGGTDDDARMKRVFHNNCTGCHAPSYVLQFRFDEAGWNKIIDLMKVVPNSGVYPANPKPNALIDYHQKQLAAYLARARGPGESSMKITPRPRPTGEAARVVWTLYDLPLNPDAGIGTKYQTNDGTDWSMGTTSKLGLIPHDGGMGFDGKLYFTVEQPEPPRHDRPGRRQDRRGQATSRCPATTASPPTPTG